MSTSELLHSFIGDELDFQSNPINITARQAFDYIGVIPTVTTQDSGGKNITYMFENRVDPRTVVHVLHTAFNLGESSI